MRRTAIVVAALLVSTVVAARGSSTSTGTRAQVASGHTVLLVTGGERTFDFAAVRRADGLVNGQARFDSDATGLWLIIDLDCLEIDGNLAKIGGKVIQANVGPVGMNVVFHAEDNGDQPTDPPDRISAGFITGASCSTFVIPVGHPGSLTDIVRGAVHVRE